MLGCQVICGLGEAEAGSLLGRRGTSLQASVGGECGGGVEGVSAMGEQLSCDTTAASDSQSASHATVNCAESPAKRNSCQIVNIQL